jgi:hypothetical protein
MFGVETKAAPAAPLSQSVPTTTSRLSEAANVRDSAKDTKSIAAIEVFISRYKDTFYGDLARARQDDPLLRYCRSGQ